MNDENSRASTTNGNSDRRPLLRHVEETVRESTRPLHPGARVQRRSSPPRTAAHQTPRAVKCVRAGRGVSTARAPLRGSPLFPDSCSSRSVAPSHVQDVGREEILIGQRGKLAPLQAGYFSKDILTACDKYEKPVLFLSADIIFITKNKDKSST
ncbi:hypothetical protein SKAU_G00007430 [Synaphobranchus kaupii]|uniref:Uncharacterized protein n=1 Tax=Synaphobranchus kaupii TaxID=118154 RepID=A0A9Q1JCM0_SYNKA|nr:hypothetical protein SKAU_G00007430 [Synaphobranchus kaupii]